MMLDPPVSREVTPGGHSYSGLVISAVSLGAMLFSLLAVVLGLALPIDSRLALTIAGVGVLLGAVPKLGSGKEYVPVAALFVEACEIVMRLRERRVGGNCARIGLEGVHVALHVLELSLDDAVSTALRESPVVRGATAEVDAAVGRLLMLEIDDRFDLPGVRRIGSALPDVVAGLGEMPEVIDHARRHEQRTFETDAPRSNAAAAS